MTEVKILAGRYALTPTVRKGAQATVTQAFDKPRSGTGKVVTVRGRDMVNGVPKEIEVSEAEVTHAIADPVAVILEGIRIALENTAPELAADIVDGGIILAGGGALLSGLEQYLEDGTGLHVRTADDPANCVTRGLATMLDDAAWRDRFLVP